MPFTNRRFDIGIKIHDLPIVSLILGVYAALAQLLKYAGDPMPNNRPIYSGLIGPICSRYDGTVSWIHESAAELFHQKGKATFFKF